VWSELTPYLGPGSAVSVLLGTVWMVITGRLMPERTHDRITAAMQSQLDAQQEANKSLQAALVRVEAQRDRLMGVTSEVTVGLVKAMPAAQDSVS
jgi:ribosomal 50S subunit-associated protein YjgA (DUF615 family)